uniref:Uncharacterized protein n=1 Tax=Zooxanthella nutricula TaxID=1333877 RepID=A0A7S2I8Q6_9DINO
MPRRPFGCSGMQTQWNLYVMFGTTSKYKLRADTELFLVPHTAMGVTLLILLILAMVQGSHGLYERSKFFLPLAFCFGLHILPAAKGIPDELADAPINEILVGLIFLGCILGAKGLGEPPVLERKDEEDDSSPVMRQHAPRILIAAWILIGVVICTAPLGEFFMMLAGSSLDHNDVDRPHPLSGKDFYSKLEAWSPTTFPWLGKIFGMGLLFTAFMYIFEIYVAWKGDAWRSPFSRDGPAIWQIIREPAPLPGKTLYLRPEQYLEATGEVFVGCMAFSWLVTSMCNPGIFRDNILRSIVGYNNLCVGFDSPPARYVAMPLLVLQAAMACRYSYLDTIRLNAGRETLSACKYWFGYIANMVFAVHMLCFPLLLVLTADFMSWTTTKIHLFLFLFTLFIMWFMIAGNVVEADSLELDTKIWFGTFTFFTFALPVVGTMDVLAFAPGIPGDQIYTVRYVKPHPPVPWPVTAFFDYGWFLLLLLTVVFMPEAPPVETRFHVEPEVLGKSYGRASSDEEEYNDDSEDSERMYSSEKARPACGLCDDSD